MKELAKYFSVSTEYKDTGDIPFSPGSILFHGANHEERSQLSSDFKSTHPAVEIVYIDELEYQEISLSFASGNRVFRLRSINDSETLTKELEGRSIYIDITGLTHSAWAWLIRSIIFRTKGDFWVLYSEPIEYRFHDAPFEGQIFDLSEKVSGITPLPGFARLSRFTSENFLFMPLLGFEGARLAHIFEDVQPSREFTFPVIGVPGFRHIFPFYTYQGNKLTLEREGIWKNRRYEKANCPASVFLLGLDFINLYPDKELRIAPIGTKPHALGAVLLKLAYPAKVDLVYDHPIRKTGRTKGKSKVLCYNLNPFLEVIKK